MNAILRAAPIVCPGDDVYAARSDVRHGAGRRGDGTGSGWIGVVLGDQSETINATMEGIFQGREGSDFALMEWIQNAGNEISPSLYL